MNPLRSAEARLTLLEDAARAMEQAAVLERFDLAIDIQTAMTAALKPPNADLQKELRTRAVEYKHWSTEWQAAQDARAKLAENDDDPKAHDVLGRYLGIVRGEWPQAFQHLSKGKDAAWRAIAESEAKYPDAAVEQASLGDKYWALGDKAAAPLKFLYLERADVWYRRAIAKLSATARTPVERSREQLSNQRIQSGAVFAMRHPLDATKIGDHWYKYYATPATWPQAVAACERVGGQLVVIESAAENQAVAQMALTERNRWTGEEKLTCWLGASDIESEGTFKWLNGKPVSGGFANWTPGEPNNAGGNEDCVSATITFSTSRVDSLWADWGEIAALDYICEWDW